MQNFRENFSTILNFQAEKNKNDMLDKDENF